MTRKESWFKVLPILAALTMTLMLPLTTWGASKYKVLYEFTGGADGGTPTGLIIDKLGNLYGTTSAGGATGNGTVFKLEPLPGGTWKETVLHSFKGPDGSAPETGLISDASGNLYGTTSQGGPPCPYVSSTGCGVVFKLKPKSDGTWTESVLYSFKGGASDGYDALAGLTFDKAGNLYGTTAVDGSGGAGDVFQLKRNSNGTWTENILYMFSGNGPDGVTPDSTLIFDGAGNLYGTTDQGGNMNCAALYGCGVAFKLTRDPGESWSESVLYTFCSETNCTDGKYPGDIVFDKAGNLYGITAGGGHSDLSSDSDGTVFRLSESGGRWKEDVLYRFDGAQGAGPDAGPILDAAGNLYGTAVSGGSANDGVVFKMSPSLDGTWAYTVLRTFLGGPARYPESLIFDGAGHLYGTTQSCGPRAKCMGIVFEVTP
jgi:uncharacterized repeat protein (TIGR03803 family)